MPAAPIVEIFKSYYLYLEFYSTGIILMRL